MERFSEEYNELCTHLDLQEGDKVILIGQRVDLVSKVKRITKTMIITENGSRFRRDSGWSVGDGYYGYGSINEWSAKEEMAINQRALSKRNKRRISDINWHMVDNKKIVKILAIIDDGEV